VALRGSRSRALAAAGGVLVALAVALLLLHPWSAGQPAARAPANGDSVPVSVEPTAWELPRLDGPGLVRLADFRGRPTVVNFFASWCGPCRAELPLLAQAAAQLGGRARFVGVDTEEQGDGLAMARRLGPAGWPLAQDVGGRLDSGLHDALGVMGMPVTAFYDAGGRLLGVRLGGFVRDTLRERLAALYGFDLR
jgi:thiol-disulfide isomerase/thioredoxin